MDDKILGKILGIFGAITIVIGIFSPCVTFPLIREIIFFELFGKIAQEYQPFSNITWIPIIILFLAIISLIIALSGKNVYLGFISPIIFVLLFIAFSATNALVEYTKSSMTGLGSVLIPFISLVWTSWILMGIGTLLLFASSRLGIEEPPVLILHNEKNSVTSNQSIDPSITYKNDKNDIIPALKTIDSNDIRVNFCDLCGAPIKSSNSLFCYYCGKSLITSQNVISALNEKSAPIKKNESELSSLKTLDHFEMNTSLESNEINQSDDTIKMRSILKDAFVSPIVIDHKDHAENKKGESKFQFENNTIIDKSKQKTTKNLDEKIYLDSNLENKETASPNNIQSTEIPEARINKDDVSFSEFEFISPDVTKGETPKKKSIIKRKRVVIVTTIIILILIPLLFFTMINKPDSSNQGQNADNNVNTINNIPTQVANVPISPIETTPKIDDYLTEANNKLTSGEYQSAISLYNKYLNYYPNDALIWYKKGEAYTSLGLTSSAKACYEKAFSIDPTIINQKNDQIKTQQQKDDISVIKQIEDYLSNANTLLYETGDFTRGLESIEKALEFNQITSDQEKRALMMKVYALTKLDRDAEAQIVTNYLKSKGYINK